MKCCVENFNISMRVLVFTAVLERGGLALMRFYPNVVSLHAGSPFLRGCAEEPTKRFGGAQHSCLISGSAPAELGPGRTEAAERRSEWSELSPNAETTGVRGSAEGGQLPDHCGRPPWGTLVVVQTGKG